MARQERVQDPIDRQITSAVAKVLRNPGTSKGAKTAAGLGITQRAENDQPKARGKALTKGH